LTWFKNRRGLAQAPPAPCIKDNARPWQLPRRALSAPKNPFAIRLPFGRAGRTGTDGKPQTARGRAFRARGPIATRLL